MYPTKSLRFLMYTSLVLQPDLLNRNTQSDLNFVAEHFLEAKLSQPQPSSTRPEAASNTPRLRMAV